MGNLYPSQIKRDSLQILNSGNFPMKLKLEYDSSIFRIWFSKNELLPGQRGTINIEYDASKLGNYGYYIDYFDFYVNYNGQELKKQFTVRATLKEDFSKLSYEQRMNAPKIFFPKKDIDLGKISYGKPISAVVKVQNQGKRTLIIHNIMPIPDCELGTFDKNIEPEEEGEIEIIFYPQKFSSQYRRNIRIISNDPSNSLSFFTIHGLPEISQDRQRIEK